MRSVDAAMTHSIGLMHREQHWPEKRYGRRARIGLNIFCINSSDNLARENDSNCAKRPVICNQSMMSTFHS